MVWPTDADEAKMLPDISLVMNYVIIDHLELNSVDICLDNMLQMLCLTLIPWQSMLYYIYNT